MPQKLTEAESLRSEKLCPKCGQVKPRSEFYVTVNRPDGLHGLCKDCDRIDQRGYWKDWRERNKEKRSIHSRKWRQSNRIKINAEACVRRAVKRRQLVRKPCEVCGEPKTHAHHDDYSKPLEVRWLCHTHHREHHMKIK